MKELYLSSMLYSDKLNDLIIKLNTIFRCCVKMQYFFLNNRIINIFVTHCDIKLLQFVKETYILLKSPFFTKNQSSLTQLANNIQITELLHYLPIICNNDMIII